MPPELRTCGARGLYGDLPSGRVRMRVGCDGERLSEGVDGAIELREGVSRYSLPRLLYLLSQAQLSSHVTFATHLLPCTRTPPRESSRLGNLAPLEPGVDDMSLNSLQTLPVSFGFATLPSFLL